MRFRHIQLCRLPSSHEPTTQGALGTDNEHKTTEKQYEEQRTMMAMQAKESNPPTGENGKDGSAAFKL